MNLIEKRDFIHSHLHFADESTLNEFYDKLRKEAELKIKLESRVLKSEAEIESGKLSSRAEVEQRTANFGNK